MGGRNPGQLRLNFGTAILIDSDYLRAIFKWQTPKNTSLKRRHLASKSKMTSILF